MICELTNSSQKKIKHMGMGVILPGFSPCFFMGLGREFFFRGSGTGEV